MRHLSRRFSGYAFLYVAIATIVLQLILLASSAASLTYFLILVIPIIAVGVSKYPTTHVLRTHGFTLPQLWFTLGIAACAALALGMLQNMLNQLQALLFYPETAQNSMASFLDFSFIPIWPHLLTSCLIPAILEGALYCGVLLSGLHQMKPLKACLTVGLMYALVQLNPISFIPNALLGFVLCYLTLRSNSVLTGMLAAFLYRVIIRYGITAYLYQFTLSPLDFSENAAAVIMCVAFILLGGWLLVKMPGRNYEKGGAKRALGKLRDAFPGLFSISSFERPAEAEMLEDSPAPEKAENAANAIAENNADTVKPEPNSLYETAAAEEPAPLDPRENNPLIAGVFVSAIATVLLLGFSILFSLGYFGGY